LANADWLAAMNAAQKWQFEQPFSSRPATFCSHIAIEVLEDFDLAVRAAYFGLQGNPEDFYLRNNLAVALATRGNTEEALLEINRAESSVRDQEMRTLFAATRGLIAFRSGLSREGRWLYNSAISIAEKHRLVQWGSLARIHLALEALRSNEPDGAQLRDEALNKAGVLTERWTMVTVQRLENYAPVRNIPDTE
jgi:predicted RNA polymerase sigma factor